MLSRLQRRLTYANVISTLALFLALSGGTAYALSGSNTVFSDDIVNNQVRPVDVRDDTLAGGGLSAVDLRAGSIGSSEVLNGSVTSADVGDQSLTGSDVQDNTINADDVFGLTGSDVQDNTINADDVFGLRGYDDIADGSLTGADVALNTLGSEDVRQEGLRGEDIDEGTLSFSPSCNKGTVRGWAHIEGDVVPTDGAMEVPNAYNCTRGTSWGGGSFQGTVNVRRTSSVAGQYLVFTNPAAPSLHALASPSNAAASDEDNFVSVRNATDCADPPCEGSFIVRVRDNDGSPEDGAFSIVLF